MSEHTQPNDWREVEPEHAAEIADAVDSVISAINRLTATTGDAFVEQAAIRWAVERLESYAVADIEGALELGQFDTPDDLDG